MNEPTPDPATPSGSQHDPTTERPRSTLGSARFDALLDALTRSARLLEARHLDVAKALLEAAHALKPSRALHQEQARLGFLSSRPPSPSHPVAPPAARVQHTPPQSDGRPRPSDDATASASLGSPRTYDEPREPAPADGCTELGASSGPSPS